MKYDLKAQVIEHARNSDIDLIGFAQVERFKNAPEGRRPTDLLDGAKTVISLGIGIPQGVRGANQKAYGGLLGYLHLYDPWV